MARLQRLQDGRVAAVAAALWSLFDALLHVVVDMVEPPRIAGNVAAIAGAGLVLLIDRMGGHARLAAVVCGLAAGLVLGFNAAWVLAERELPVPAAVFIVVAFGLLAWAAYRFLVKAGRPDDEAAETGAQIPISWAALTAVLLVAAAAISGIGGLLTSVQRQLHRDELVAADYWSDELVILSAGFGFDNIVGTAGDDFDVTREAGGTWLENPDCVNDEGPLTSAFDARFINQFVRGTTDYDDGLPIVTSWPVLPSTLHPEDFLSPSMTGPRWSPMR